MVKSNIGAASMGKEKSVSRETTEKLLEAIESGLLDRDHVILACVKYMSEANVADMCHANEIYFDEEEETEDA